MNEVQEIAESARFHSIYIEAYDEISLADVLAKALRPIILKLSRKEAAHHLAIRARAGLRIFASAFNVIWPIPAT